MADGQKGHKPINIETYLTRCTLDIILTAAMGIKLDVLRNSQCAYIDSLKRVTETISER